MSRDKYITIDLYCDGKTSLGNNVKPPDCPDGSDENLKVCCEGNYPAYDATICNNFKQCDTENIQIASELYCDGRKMYGNANKQPDCADGSDEVFETCCEGDYAAYPDELCSS